MSLRLDWPITFLTSEVFPHLLGEMRMVLMPCVRFASRRFVSSIRSVKYSSSTALPNSNGFSIIHALLLYFCKISKKSLSKKLLSKNFITNQLIGL